MGDIIDYISPFLQERKKEAEGGFYNMYKLLIVDDEEKIRALIKKYAVFEEYEVSEASDGMEAVSICRKQRFDVIIMDVMMPELDGFSACREIRKFSDTPVIMLSARGEEYDKIHGFELGVDDYVVKPFSPRELMMRVNAVIRRSTAAEKNTRDIEANIANTPESEIFEYQGLSVNFTARIVTIDGVRVNLSPKEYDLLFFMVRNRNIALSREKLLNEVWGYDFFGDDRTLDTHIKLLRRSLGAYSDLIVTLRGVGYRFEA